MQQKIGVSTRFPSLSHQADPGFLLQVLCLRGNLQEALEVLSRTHFPLSPAAYCSLLKACGIILDEQQYDQDEQMQKVIVFEITQAIHSSVRMMGFAANLVVSTALLSVYGKCGALLVAENVFQSVFEHDIISWTAMLTSYVEQNQAEKALLLYLLMQQEGMHPNTLTLVGALQACTNLAEKEGGVVVNGNSVKAMSLRIGHALHMDSCIDGHVSDALLSTALITMYSKCGAIIEAHEVFLDLPQRDMVAWNTILTAYVDQGDGAKALSLCGQMIQERTPFDEIALLCILKACNESGNVELCRQLHFAIITSRCDEITSVASTLIASYGGGASMSDAEGVFVGMCVPDIVSWTACISGHAGEGNYHVSFNLFENLKQEGNVPDDVTFTSILSVCCHNGLLSRGLEFFKSMSREYGISYDVRHYSIVIDLLARAGDFNRVEKILIWMQMKPDCNIWLSLLSACRIHNNLKLAEHAFNQAIYLQPKQSGSFFLMANIYNVPALFEASQA